MSQAINLMRISIIAAAVLSARRFVTTDGNYAGAGLAADGVTYTDAEAIGDAVAATHLGTAQVEAGAAIAADAEVEVGANGKVITRTAGVKVGKLMPGSVADADGDVVEVLLFLSNRA